MAHVRQSKYLIQVVKCQTRKCCQPPRTNLPSILPGRFLPPLVLYETTSCGIVCGSVDSKTGHFYDFGTRIALDSIRPFGAPVPMPNDYYCPSVAEKIKEYLCKRCGLYLVTKGLLKSHMRLHNDKAMQQPQEDSCESDDETEEFEAWVKETENLQAEVTETEEVTSISDIAVWWNPDIVDADTSDTF